MKPKIGGLIDISSLVDEIPVNLVILTWPMRAEVIVIHIRACLYKCLDFTEIFEPHTCIKER